MAIENDIILIYREDEPLSFARIEDISADSKPDWYHVKLLMLQLPPQIITWILRDVYIEGAEFTMNGKRMRLEKVVVPDEPPFKEPITKNRQGEAAEKENVPGKAKVISLADMKRNNQ